MAEIYRMLLVTLLLYLFWLPSVDATLMSMPEGSSEAESQIDNLLSSYFSYGCKDIMNKYVEGYTRQIMDDPGCSAGERYILELLLSYFSSGCKVVGTDVGAIQGSGYSNGQRHIIKVLSTYFSSGCKAAKAVDATDVESTQDPSYSVGERYISKKISSNVQFSNCKEPGKSGEGGKTDTAVRPVQSIVLELVLLIFGMCLTWIEL